MTSTIEYASDEEIKIKAAAICEHFGMTVIDKIIYMRPREIRMKFGIKNASTLTMKLRRYTGDLLVQQGPKGSIRAIHITSKLHEYLSNAKKTTNP